MVYLGRTTTSPSQGFQNVPVTIFNAFSFFLHRDEMFVMGVVQHEWSRRRGTNEMVLVDVQGRN